jgi:uncharacterized heparinase superfamily protein
MRDKGDRVQTSGFRLLRLLRTIRYLRPAQVYGRLQHALRGPVRPDGRATPPTRVAEAAWKSPCTRAPSLLDPDRVRLLDLEREIRSRADWNRADWPMLWLYNLHYFDDLNAGGDRSRVALQSAWIGRWIADNPPCAGVGWEPYPLSLRIVNWIKWQLGPGRFDDAMLHSLAQQARALRRQLETHLLGNHLWANAKALVFAGSFFAGDEADAWLRTGLAIARRELSEQVLADGGHFERSAMYHSIVLEDLLDLIALAHCHPSTIPSEDAARWREAVPRMLQWLAVMTHPDGEIALFNDAAFGVAPKFSELAGAATTLGFPRTPALDQKLVLLADSGYARLQIGDAVLIADVAPLGPDYLPGHGHADTLSFELSLDGERTIVDAGTSRYDVSPERQWQRGTSAHNTVEVDGADSSEVWSSFRVARRARPFEVGAGVEDDHVWLRGAHDGYRRLPGHPVHRRIWRLYPDRLEIEDHIEGEFRQAVARLRSPANTGWSPTADGIGLRIRRLQVEGASRVETIHGTWHPRFGASLDATTVTATFAADKMRTILWFQ